MSWRMAVLGMLVLWGSGVMAQDNRIDTLRPAAPALAQLGKQAVGVKTLRLVNPNQLNILKTEAGKAPPIYDRPLTVELWYPAQLAAGQEARGQYRAITRDGKTEVTLFGKAVRDAQADMSAAPYPLIVISHGYPGNRFLLSHFGENLASKGYVVASIDHTESTYSDQAAFASTLLNRPLDQLFVVNELDKLSRGNNLGLKGLINADATGLIGYSMGGYGVLNVLGGGFTAVSTALNYAPLNKLLSLRQSGNPQYMATMDKRIKAAIAIGPWGWNAGFWDGETLEGIKTPIFFMAGSADDVSGYSPGIRNIFEASVNAERYLLIFENAKHNAAAPIPAPKETLQAGTVADHYRDPVWDTTLMNNIAQHFATAWFGKHLKGDGSMDVYLNLPETGNWRGFVEGGAKGLKLEYRKPAQ